MNQVKAEFSKSIAYYIDFSIQEIPHVVYIARKTGGVVYTNSEQTASIFQRDFPDISLKYLQNINAIKNDMIRSKIRAIAYPDYHIRYFKELQGVKHIQVFHGLSDKRYDYSRQVLDYDLFFIPGRYSYEKYRKKGLLRKGTGKLIGYPKFDRVFTGEIDGGEIKSKLKIDKSLPVVLYAPTWVDKSLNSSWKKFYRHIMYNKPEWIHLIVKPHPNLVRYRKSEIAECKEFARKIDSVTVLEDVYDITPVLAAADILIGDVSSVTREFLAFKRPMVFLSNKPKWMWRKEKITLWDCGYVVTDPKKIWHYVEKTVEDPYKFFEHIENHFKETFYKPDGHAADRAAEEIIKLLSA